MPDLWIEIGVLFHFFGHVHNTVFSKRRDGVSILRVKGNELITGCHREYPRLLPIRPVRHAPAVLAYTVGARSFIDSPDPSGLTRAWIRGNHGTAVASREVENAFHHQRRRLVLVLRLTAIVLAMPNPRNLQVLNIGSVD